MMVSWPKKFTYKFQNVKKKGKEWKEQIWGKSVIVSILSAEAQSWAAF